MIQRYHICTGPKVLPALPLRNQYKIAYHHGIGFDVSQHLPLNTRLALGMHVLSQPPSGSRRVWEWFCNMPAICLH